MTSLEAYLRGRLRFGPSRNGSNFMVSCPRPELHKNGDKNPSCSVDVSKGLVHCFVCGLSGNVYQIAKELGWPPPPGDSGSRLLNSGSLPLKMNPHPTRQQNSVSNDAVERMHSALAEEDRAYLRTERQLTDEVIDRYQLGTDGERLAIPIPESDGLYRDVRRWLPPEMRKYGEQKVLHWKRGFGAPRLFPCDQLRSNQLVLAEGELDALAAISNGIAAITVTAGVQTWTTELFTCLSGKTITVLSDNDGAGRKGAQKRIEALGSQGCIVRLARWLGHNG